MSSFQDSPLVLPHCQMHISFSSLYTVCTFLSFSYYHKMEVISTWQRKQRHHWSTPSNSCCLLLWQPFNQLHYSFFTSTWQHHCSKSVIINESANSAALQGSRKDLLALPSWILFFRNHKSLINYPTAEYNMHKYNSENPSPWKEHKKVVGSNHAPCSTSICIAIHYIGKGIRP